MGLSKHIFLVTWTGFNNYGTHLQCYSLFRVIQDKGYYVSLLAPFNINSTIKNIVKYLMDLLGVFTYKEKKLYSSNLKLKKVYNFHKDNIKVKHIYTRRQYRKILNSNSVFVSGSDQIWNTFYSFTPFYFLDFAKHCKKIAYASSIGGNSVNPEYADQVKLLLQSFQHIGVREESTVSVLNELTGRNDIRQVLDPTFLLSSNDWYDFSKDAIIERDMPQKYIFVYLIGKNKEYVKQVEHVRKVLGIKDVVIVKSGENPDFSLNDSINYADAGPKEFVKMLLNASFICTDSFHATALSINNSKSFVEFLRFKDTDQKSQNSRIYDLLANYSLKDRFYGEAIDKWSSLIDYKEISVKLAMERKVSLEYLIESIEK